MGPLAWIAVKLGANAARFAAGKVRVGPAKVALRRSSFGEVPVGARFFYTDGVEWRKLSVDHATPLAGSAAGAAFGFYSPAEPVDVRA